MKKYSLEELNKPKRSNDKPGPWKPINIKRFNRFNKLLKKLKENVKEEVPKGTKRIFDITVTDRKTGIKKEGMVCSMVDISWGEYESIAQLIGCCATKHGRALLSILFEEENIKYKGYEKI